MRLRCALPACSPTAERAELAAGAGRNWRRALASEAGKAAVRDHATAEDIHHFVELKLVERVGSLGLQAAHRPQPQ